MLQCRNDTVPAPAALATPAPPLDNEVPQNFDPRPNTPPLSKCPREELPGWTKGIRKLYNTVTQEPLPADFQDLLTELSKTIAH
jgi:hypothetical protein